MTVIIDFLLLRVCLQNVFVIRDRKHQLDAVLVAVAIVVVVLVVEVVVVVVVVHVVV